MPVMPNLASLWVAAPIDEVFAFYDDPSTSSRLMPPPVRIRLVRVEPAPPQPGSIFEFRYGLGPIQRTWIVRLIDRVENERFVDETLSGPMAPLPPLAHLHARPQRGTWIEDRVDFHVGPDGPVGVAVDFVAGLRCG